MRLTTPKGSDHPRARFTPEEVEEILKNHDKDPRPPGKIADERGCSRTTMRKILNRESYR